MFAGWSDYFLLIGTAAATLIGLLFIVVSLTSGMEEKNPQGVKVFTTPVVFHLTMALTVSALLLAPRPIYGPAGGLVALCALIGLGYAVFVSIRLGAPGGVEPSHWSDVWFYGVTPGAIYLAMLGAAWTIGQASDAAPFFVGATLLALLLASIRNAWDLITWIAPRSKGPAG